MTAAPPEIIVETVRRSSPPEIIQTAGAPETVRAYQIAGAAAERTGAPQDAPTVQAWNSRRRSCWTG